jgi:hypothetical protein
LSHSSSPSPWPSAREFHTQLGPRFDPAVQEEALDQVAPKLGAVRRQPDNYEPYHQMGNPQLLSLGDKAAARQWYLKAFELNPRHPGTRHMLGQL